VILIVFIARTLRHTPHTQADAGVGDGGVCVGVVVMVVLVLVVGVVCGGWCGRVGVGRGAWSSR
jgi:hypothetical protein